MTDVSRVIITIRRPSVDGTDPGQVEEGFYRRDGSAIVMTDSAGIPVTDMLGNEWRAEAAPGQEHVIAGRLVRQVRSKLRLNRDEGFGRVIQYPPLPVA